jgi:hypothetical protein
MAEDVFRWFITRLLKTLNTVWNSELAGGARKIAIALTIRSLDPRLRNTRQTVIAAYQKVLTYNPNFRTIAAEHVGGRFITHCLNALNEWHN